MSPSTGENEMDPERALREKLLTFATSKRYDDEIARAFNMFWGGRRSLAGSRLDEADSSRFLEWYMFDYRTERYGKALVELFREFRGHTLPDDQRELLRQWRQTRFGMYELTSVRETTLTLRDVFENDVLTVENLGKYPGGEGDLLLGRILSGGHVLHLSGTVIRIPNPIKETVKQRLTELFKEYGQTVRDPRWRSFFREWGHRVNQFLIDLRDGRA